MTSRVRPALVVASLALSTWLACSEDDDAPPSVLPFPEATSATTTTSGAGGSGVGGGLSVGGNIGTGGNPPAMIVETLPPGFTAETEGGWNVVGPLEGFTPPGDNTCANVLTAVARDFTQAHIDFGEQKPANWMAPGLYQGHVLPTLGGDRKPDVNPNRSPLDVMEAFGEWYTSVPDVNVGFVIELWLEPDEGTFRFDSNSFFPLDQVNQNPEDVQVGGADDAPHNFLFTIELHTSFEYTGGEVFNFRGDDDVFVFINGQLAVDIGGIHGPLVGEVNLDAQAEALGIEPGNVYDLDLFQAERNPTGSNFRIETTLDFTDCGVLPDDIK